MRNVTLGRQVLDHVTTHRYQFDMNWYARLDPECGTVACLAGWAMLLSGYRLNEDWSFGRPDMTLVGDDRSDEAVQLFGLTDDEYFGTGGEPYTLFAPQPEDEAIERFRAIVEAAEAAS